MDAGPLVALVDADDQHHAACVAALKRVREPADIPRIRELMRKYAGRSMDMADAGLVRVAEREGVPTLFTVDRKDFAVYRLHGRVRIDIIP